MTKHRLTIRRLSQMSVLTGSLTALSIGLTMLLPYDSLSQPLPPALPDSLLHTMQNRGQQVNLRPTQTLQSYQQRIQQQRQQASSANTDPSNTSDYQMIQIRDKHPTGFQNSIFNPFRKRVDIADDSPTLSQNKPVPATPDSVDNSKVVDGDLIRVGISDDAMTSYEYPKTQVTATGRFQIWADTHLVFEGSSTTPVEITLNSSGFWLRLVSATHNQRIDGSPFRGPVKVVSTSPDSQLTLPMITRHGKVPSYRGYLEIVRGTSSPQKLSVVNVLPLQQYLKAVVPNELPPRFGLEAIRAQAVAARNYALHPREKPWPQFDICDSQYCQVYLGAQTETPETNTALKETEGLVALYSPSPFDTDLILALYSSSSGGYSEDYSNAFSDPKTNQFPAPAIPYLRGIPDKSALMRLDLSSEEAARKFWLNPDIDSFDSISPHYRWEKEFSQKTLQNLFQQNLAKLSADKLDQLFIHPAFSEGDRIGTIEQIRVLRRGVSGKVMALEIQTSTGTWTLEKELVIRKAFASNGKYLPSANFILTPDFDNRHQLISYQMNGGGFGHGVGMSQYGASAMNKQGFRFSDIIKHYYSGVSLGTIPLEVGGDDYHQPVKHRFYVKQAQGVLVTHSSQTGMPLRVSINDKMLTLSQRDTRQSVSSLLKPGQLNELTLYPDSKNPNRAIKAWIELYPAQRQNVARD